MRLLLDVAQVILRCLLALYLLVQLLDWLLGTLNIAMAIAVVLLSVSEALISIILQLRNLLLDRQCMLLVQFLLVILLGVVQDGDCLLRVLLSQMLHRLFPTVTLIFLLIGVSLSLWLLLRNVLGMNLV